MIYLALGDSISIDDYTGVPGGGAASQFARLIGAAQFDNRTKDGCTTRGVLEALQQSFGPPDVVTLTASGNDLLVALETKEVLDNAPSEIARRYDEIVEQLGRLACPVIINTVYDPTDGDDNRAVEMGLTGDVRRSFDLVNRHIRSRAGGNLVLCDLEELFQGHGYWSGDPWITGYIEPNLAGATAIAERWRNLYRAWIQAD
jgi:hypothetical protein